MKKATSIILGFVVFIFSAFGFIWYSVDSITRAAIETDAVLLAEPFLSDKKIVAWLEQYHGEAPSHQVMISFVAWGNSHPEKFRRIIEQLNKKTLERVAWAAQDSS